MTKRRIFVVTAGLILIFAGFGAWMIHRGFRATDEPSRLEKILARGVRNFSIPSSEKKKTNPLPQTSENLETGREDFRSRCSSCHGFDGAGKTAEARGLYPKPPDLSGPATQKLSDGQIHYIIAYGVRLSGMPAWNIPHETSDVDAWKLTMFVRSLGRPNPAQLTAQSQAAANSHYVGSKTCEKCHADLYARWVKTPMANVVRDPKEHPDAIFPDLATNKIAPFKKDQVAFVYGSIWKQRYFEKVGDDYFPLGAQWDIVNKAWKPYLVPKGADWWVPFYPEDNRHRPTGPLCDGCHSVGYDIKTKQVAEWNVGCERCHGPGSEHSAHPTSANIFNPAHMDYVAANDTCIQCHSQGQPLQKPIEGKYYDWPVGFRAGLRLQDFWSLEPHKLGELTFNYFPEGTSHKNRMQGNDYVQSVMYRRGVTCADCHDVHGTGNYAQLREPPQMLCLECHGPKSPNGPREETLEAHTHHKEGSAGSECIACHMPKIETTLGTTMVRAHTFGFISPAETEKYSIPNACTDCHKDKTTRWAADALRAWPSRSPWRVQADSSP
ncbi:MAG TPA: c-type cytochrome [Candidatus Acidoferrum sp.]|nr:c-type cytochrome [Candidatus Acidoferrum sp.]